MNRLGILDPTTLPAFAALETISTEAILAARMAKLKELWALADPPAAALYDVDELEFDPLKINQEVSTYIELTVRDRVNQTARAVTLAFAVGGDLDAIASRYPGGVPRLPDEADDRYRRRIWLSPSTLTPHGTEEAYVFWALSADPTLHDASATTVEGTGQVNVTLMASGADPRPTLAQLLAVRAYILANARKGLTDIVSVLSPTVVQTRISLDVWLYSGPDAVTTLMALRSSLETLVVKQAWLGWDNTLMAIAAAAGVVSGVQNVVIREPVADIPISLRSVVQVTGIDLNLAGRRE